MQTFNIGRNTSNNLVLDDKMVSRQHAQLIVLDNGQVIIKDLGSSNGTFVNGNKITECTLKAGDIVKCGNTFVKWTQYVSGFKSENQSSPNPVNYNWNQQQVSGENDDVVINNDFKLTDSLKYVFSKIFNVGDLFKNEWDRIPSILFFSLVPIIVILISCFVAYFKADILPFHQIVLLPVIVSICCLGISQFLTISLFSITRETTIIKNLLASSIFSFLQFLTLFVMGIFGLLFYSFASDAFYNFGEIQFEQSPALPVLFYLLSVSVTISISITLIIFLFKFYLSIGVSKGLSIHYTVFSFSFNLLIQLAIIYIFYRNIF